MEPLSHNAVRELREPRELDNGALYIGEWSRATNMRDGRGIQIWSDNSCYEGYWKDDKANGRGKLVHADGDVYEGDWKDDKAHGIGIYTHQDGARYDGEWFEDKQHGKGRKEEGLTNPTQASRHGQMGRNMRDTTRRARSMAKVASCGRTSRSTTESSSITTSTVLVGSGGETGVYKWSDGRAYEGEWKNNKMDGKGDFSWADGRKYSGEYVDDKKQGYGVFQWPDGRRYEGYWHNGK